MPDTPALRPARALRAALAIVATIAPLVPRARRAGWRRQWRADSLVPVGVPRRPGRRGSPRLVRARVAGVRRAAARRLPARAQLESSLAHHRHAIRRADAGEAAGLRAGGDPPPRAGRGGQRHHLQLDRGRGPPAAAGRGGPGPPGGAARHDADPPQPEPLVPELRGPAGSKARQRRRPGGAPRRGGQRPRRRRARARVVRDRHGRLLLAARRAGRARPGARARRRRRAGHRRRGRAERRRTGGGASRATPAWSGRR